MNTRQLAALALVACLCMSCESASIVPEPEDVRSELGVNLIDSHRATVGGVSLGSSESDVIAALGEPLSVEESFDEPTAKPAKDLFYEQIKVYLVGNEVYDFSCRDRSCETYDGVRIGDSWDKVTAVYGEGSVYPEDQETVVIYDIRGMDAGLIFHIAKDRVVMIRLFIDYV